MTTKVPADHSRTLHLWGVLVGLSIALGACTQTTGTTGELTAGIPNDYRQRHPIAIQEANRSVDVFVGNSRGGLTASQRGDVMGLAQTWLREGTGAISADVPTTAPHTPGRAVPSREVRAMPAARR